MLVWTLVPTLSNVNLPLDTIEALAWGSNLEWGFNKHPPLSAILVEFIYLIFGSQDWSYYLLSQICVIIAFIFVWKFSEEIFDEMKEEIPAVKDNLPFLPSAPIIPVLEAQEPLFIEIEHKTTYWPWDQQDEWPFSELKEQVLTAMRAAIEKNIAQATVIIDEVGPHLGDQANLMYPIGKLLDTIGRKNAVDKMIVSAFKYAPNDPNVIQAKQKLRP